MAADKVNFELVRDECLQEAVLLREVVGREVAKIQELQAYRNEVDMQMRELAADRDKIKAAQKDSIQEVLKLREVAAE